MATGLSTRKKVAFSVVTTVLVLAGLNAAVSLKEQQQYGVTHAQKEDLYRETESGRKVLKAGVRVQGASSNIGTNSMGFRGPELADPKPDNGYRIWVVGGSTTFDVFAPDDARTWPALVGKRLGEAHPDRVVEVINAGIPGEVIAGNIEDFKLHAAAVKPDLLIYYHGPNDLRDIRFGGPPPPSGPLEQQFALLRATRGAVNKRYPSLPEAWADARMSSHDLNEMTRRIELLIDAATRQGAAVLMANHAYQHTEGKTGNEALGELGEICVLMQMHPDNVVHMFRDYNTLVAGIAERKGLPFADVQGAVPSDANYWGDALHFSAAGSELAAGAVVAAIEAAELL